MTKESLTMTANPEVSIVIPVYNEELNLPELIERCVKACDQLPQSYEILLVDDGSRDRSVELIQEGVNGKLSRLPVETQEKVQAALTKMLNEGEGGMITILL